MGPPSKGVRPGEARLIGGNDEPMPRSDMSIRNALYLSRRPAAAFVIVGLFWGCFAAYVPVLKDQLGANDRLFGLLLLGSATGLVSAMWIAPRADRVLGPRGMQVGAVCLACVWLLPGEISTPIIFAGALALIGLSSGLLDVVMNARVSELEAKHGLSLMNANHAMFSVAYAIAAIITGIAREAGMPPTPVFAGFGLIAILMVPMLPGDVGFDDGSGAFLGASGRRSVQRNASRADRIDHFSKRGVDRSIRPNPRTGLLRVRAHRSDQSLRRHRLFGVLLCAHAHGLDLRKLRFAGGFCLRVSPADRSSTIGNLGSAPADPSPAKPFGTNRISRST